MPQNDIAPIIRSRFTRPSRVPLVCRDVSLTQGEFADEADINNVILRFSSTGEFPPRLNARVGEFLDVSEVSDLHEALVQVQGARALFDELPLEVREAVDFDPGRLLDALDEHARMRASTEEDVSKLAKRAKPAKPDEAPAE